MRILAPADSAREAELLIGAGAGALYFGFMPDSWLTGHSFFESFNRRTFPEAHLTSWEEVSRLAEAAAAASVPLSAVFNAAYYPPWMYQEILEVIDRLAGEGVTGFIVSDLALICALDEEGIGPLTLSTMGGVTNSKAAGFFRDLGAARINLPRILSTAQIRKIARDNPRMAFDVFALYGACANIEAFCRWIHDDPGRIWPCVQEYLGPDSGLRTGPLSVALGAQRRWSGRSRIWACGLCAIRDLSSEGNIEGLKIVGRGAPTDRKLAGVKMIRTLLEAVERGIGPSEDFCHMAKKIRKEFMPGDCHPYLCLYEEYL